METPAGSGLGPGELFKDWLLLSIWFSAARAIGLRDFQPACAATHLQQLRLLTGGGRISSYPSVELNAV
eukprot:4040235-Pyramimonas_sp.AAC.1